MKVWLIIFLVLMVSHRVQSQTRLVVNTTCLELAKPSNQQLRLTCRRYDYHCLLDETFTKEFEVCREWKWITGGNCAYFNTYGSGNVDERKCVPGINLTCSESKHQFESKTNTKYSACYARREIGTYLSTTTSLIQVTLNRTSDGDFPTSSPSSKIWVVFLIFIVLLSSIFVIFFILIRCKPLRIKDIITDRQKGEEESVEIISSLCYETKNSEREDKEDNGESTNVLDDNASSLQRITSPTVVCQRDDNHEYQTEEAGNDESEDDNGTSKMLIPTAESLKGGGLSTENDDEESADSTSSLSYESAESEHEDEEDNEESTNLFDENINSLQRITPTTDEQEIELYEEIFSLLDTDGRKLSHDVITTVITRNTGKSVNILLNTLRSQQNSESRRALPEEFEHILGPNSEKDTPFFVSYGLHLIYLDEKHSPKSGWGNPVRNKDIGTGDDVERLYRIQNIVRGISNPLTVSIETYIRLLDIMVEALIRLDPSVEFRKDYKAFANKLTSIRNPTLTHKMIRNIRKFLKL